MAGITVRKSDVWHVVEKVFPEYRGRKFTIEPCASLTFWDTNWGGGSRTYYAAVALGGQAAQLNVPAPWDNPYDGLRVQMRPDVLVVAHRIFCGHDMGIRIYAHPDAMPKLLKAV